MNFDLNVASALGFPKPHYFIVERERRWLCTSIPHDLILKTEEITDVYVTGAKLRLRAARPLSGGAAMLRLTRKADVNSHTRFISSIYLQEEEFQLLLFALSGPSIRKLRHRLREYNGYQVVVDEFQDKLLGLVMLEVEFENDAELSKFGPPAYTAQEVTDDVRFTGGWLATNGLPSSPSAA